MSTQCNAIPIYSQTFRKRTPSGPRVTGPLTGGVLICLREETKTKTKLETKHEKTGTQKGTNAPEHVS